MTVAAITRLTRRTWGLTREIWAIRCPYCRWRTEVADLPTAVSLVRLHTCRNHKESA